MLNSDEALKEKINDFLRRKEAKYPELAQPYRRERIIKETYKPVDKSLGNSWTLNLET